MSCTSIRATTRTTSHTALLPSLAFTALCALTLLLSGCGGDSTGPDEPPPPPAAVASVAMTPNAATLVAPQTLQLSATPRDQAGNALTRAVNWSSATPAVATVSATGLVTAVGAGSATITATSEGRSGTARITVGEGRFVGASGGTVTANGATVTVPAGAVSTGTAFTLTPQPSPPAHPRRLAASAWTLGPDGTTFGQPVTVTLSWTAAQGDSGALPEQFAVNRWDGLAYTELTDRQVDTTARTVSGRASATGVFAIIERPSAPRPTLALLNPTQAVAGGAAFTLTATGTGFGATTVLRFNGETRPTTLTSDSTLTAQISAADIAAAATAQVTVFTPAPGGGVSEAVAFPITAPHPVPVLTSLSPDTVQAGSNAFVLAATGSGFLASSVIHWNGAARPTTFVSPTELRAAIPAADVASGVLVGAAAVGSAAITVVSPAPGGGLSGARTLTIIAPPPPNIGPTTLSAGGEHSCGIADSGIAYCWGNGDVGQLGTGATAISEGPVAVADGHAFARVAAGGNTTCALKSNGEAWCWGMANSGRLGNGQSGDRARPSRVSGGLSFVSIATGANHSCAVATGGAAYCWGSGSSGGLGTGIAAHSVDEPQPVIGGHSFASIAVGLSHSCALTPDGTAWCWGENGSGQLGNGDMDDRAEPVLVAGSQRFTRIVAGGSHSCALTAAGVAYCWGGNAGQLGIGSTGANQLAPVAVAGSHSFTALALGGQHSCGLRTDGALLCWGEGVRGQLGGGTTGRASSPAPVSGGLTFSAIATSAFASCGVASGQLYCWGQGEDGALGNGAAANQLTPRSVAGAPALAAVQGGGEHMCGVTAAGAGWCWGTRVNGQLGDGLALKASAPVAVRGDHRFAQLSAGHSHSCGINDAGMAFCWGEGAHGRLGNGSTDDQFRPTAVAGGHTFRSISAGFEHTCALTTNGLAYCWGQPSVGRLGHGALTGGLQPVAVSGGRTYTTISAGATHSCAVAEDGAAYCWGNQLGVGSLGASPALVGGGQRFATIDAGGDLTCGVTIDGRGYCWGRNNFGQVGNGTMSNAPMPVEVAGDRRYTHISAGGLTVAVQACGVTTSGAAYCWGRNSSGQLGIGSFGGNELSPIAVTGAYQFRSMSVGTEHSCGVTTAGVALCWGSSGTDGRTGLGESGSARATPTPVVMPAALSAGETFVRW